MNDVQIVTFSLLAYDSFDIIIILFLQIIVLNHLNLSILHSFQEFGVVAEDGYGASFHLQSYFAEVTDAVAVETRVRSGALSLAVRMKEMQ